MHKLRMMGISPMDDSLQSEHLAWPENKAVVITGQQWERGNTKPRVGGNRITPTSSLMPRAGLAVIHTKLLGSYSRQALYVASAGRRGLWQ